LFLKAAWLNNPIAQNRLARLLSIGRGIARDRVQAAKWHILARAVGITDASLDTFLNSLTVDERTKVDEAVRAHIAAQPSSGVYH
jgi:uncharacterized protein